VVVWERTFWILARCIMNSLIFLTLLLYLESLVLETKEEEEADDETLALGTCQTKLEALFALVLDQEQL
jgi:hypothetical protein